MAVKIPYLNSLKRGLVRLLAALNLLLYSLTPIQINKHLAAETLITKYLQNGTQIKGDPKTWNGGKYPIH